MQQANRVSDYTAFFNTEKKDKDLAGKIGFLVEFDKTKNMFNSPKQNQLKTISLENLVNHYRV